MTQDLPILTRCQNALREALKLVNPAVEFVDSREVRLTNIADNLIVGVDWDSIEQMYLDADGNETHSKMLAPWSSSALVANSFGPWVGRASELRFLGRGGFTRLNLEEKCPNGLPGNDPNLDAVLENDSEILAVESKLLEYLRVTKPARFSPKYELIGDFRAESRWSAAIPEASSFRRLDAAQLIKHYFGVAKTFPHRKATIVYLYWEPSNADEIPECLEHRQEIDRFADLVLSRPGEATEIGFEACSYTTHWNHELELADAHDSWMRVHIENLKRRYDVAV